MEIPTIEEYKLVAHTCEESGVTGLVLARMNQAVFQDGDIFVMSDSIGVAHDIVEHPNGIEAIGTVEDEFEALGAIWYTRGRHSDLRRDGTGSMYSPEHHLAADLCRMAVYDYREVPDQPEGDHEEALECIIEEARDMIRGEYQPLSDYNIDLEHYLHNALQGMRLGVVKQAQRYPEYTGNNKFWNIADAVEPWFNRIEWDGQEFMLTINNETQDVRVCEHYEEEDY